MIPLGPLAPADAARRARRHTGLDAEQAAAVNRFVRGHPLSLQLAASALKEHPDAVIPTVTAGARRALPRRAGRRDPRGARRRLRAAARHALAAPRRLRAPRARCRSSSSRREGLVDPRHGARGGRPRCCAPPTRSATARTAPRPGGRSAPSCRDGGWASVADMIALVEEPLVREAFFPTAVQHYAVETARPSDRDAILAIVARHHAGATTRADGRLVGRGAGRVPGRAQPARDRGRVHDPVRPRARPAGPVHARPALPGVARAPARAPGAEGPARAARRGSRSPTAPAPRRRRASPRCCATSSAPRWRPASVRRDLLRPGRGRARRAARAARLPPDRRRRDGVRPRPGVRSGLAVRRSPRATCAVGPTRRSTRRARAHARGAHGRADEARVRRPALPAGPRGPGRRARRRCCATSGATSGPAARTPSTWRSPGCGASSASRRRRWRPCEGRAFASAAL